MSLSQKSEGLGAASVSTSDLGEAWRTRAVSEGRQSGVLKNKQARSERGSFPERFLLGWKKESSKEGDVGGRFQLL